MLEIEKLHLRFCDYSETLKGNSPRSIEWFKRALKRYLDYNKISSVEEVTQQDIEDWLLYGRTKYKWSSKTIRNYIQSLSSFFDWCIKKEYLKTNPTKKIPRPKLPKQIPQHLPKEQAELLLHWTRSISYTYEFEKFRSPAIIATFIFTGIRVEELRSLKVNDVDLEHQTLFVKNGKGAKDRIVPLNTAIIEILEMYLKHRKLCKKSCPYFFTSIRSDTQMGEQVIDHLVEKIRKKSGIYFYPHMLRHTFAVLMLEGGCDLFALSKMMGHSDIKTTTIYLSATTSHLQEQIKKHPLDSI